MPSTVHYACGNIVPPAATQLGMPWLERIRVCDASPDARLGDARVFGHLAPTASAPPTTAWPPQGTLR
eukprot:830950-Pleurochrysis_carterae.AAC.1